MVGSELGSEIRGIFGGVDGQGLWNDQQGVGELGDSQLLTAADRGGKVLEVDGEGRLDAAAARHNLFGFHDALDDAEGVVDGSLHFVAVEVVGGAQNDRGSCSDLWARD